MKIIRRTLALVMASVMLFSLAGCKKKGLKEYSRDEMVKKLEDKLGMTEDNIYLGGNDGTQNDLPVSEELSAKYGNARIIAHFIKDASDAKKCFETYDLKYEDFDSKDEFNGGKLHEKKDDYGYIVIKGTDVGTDIFGDRHASGDLYGAIYYSGSMVVIISNEETDSGLEDVEAIIKALGYPCIK